MNLKKINWRDVGIRAVKTFVQAFIGAVTIDSLIGITDADALKKALVGLAVAGVSAGVSALWNFVKGYIDSLFADERNAD